MTEYQKHAEALFELSVAKQQIRTLAQDYLELRERHDRQDWWNLAGAGSSASLASQIREALVEDRSALKDYWYFPSGKHNPYLDLLYAELPAMGWNPRELRTLAELDELGPGSVVHLHWIESLRPNQDDEAKNLAALDKARTQLLRFKRQEGTRLLWSVHEPLPHGSRWPEHDASFHQFLADNADWIHLLHDSTIESCAEHFTIDAAKTFTVPLPLYTDVYPNYRSRASARALVGVGDDELCVAFLGALRPYKGIEQLVEASATAATGRPLRLVVAGMPVEEASELAEQIRATEYASIAPMLVPDSEIQTILAAADVVVVPYVKFLNSAVLMLALSFDTPVIASENPVTIDARDSGMVSTYTEVDGLVQALLAAEIAPQRELADAFVAAHAPGVIGGSFAQAVDDRLTTEP
jgi:glycosyltransferase involved in cell wall biosynthesis